MAPGALLAAIEGRADWPHAVYRQYWPIASAHSFDPLPAAEQAVPAAREPHRHRRQAHRAERVLPK
jgi:hypothetical protein